MALFVLNRMSSRYFDGFQRHSFVILTAVLVTSFACLFNRPSITKEINPYEVYPDFPWFPWLQWSSCSSSCGDKGVRQRQRHYFFRLSTSSKDDTERKQCKNFVSCPTPVHGGWNAWSSWSECSGLCYRKGINGEKLYPESFRSRACINPYPQHGGRSCEGSEVESRKCRKVSYCGVDGGWSDWYIETPCRPIKNVSCSRGYQVHRRTCSNPVTEAPGKYCEGLEVSEVRCWYMQGCPASIQTPKDFEVICLSEERIQISWFRSPYGLEVTLFGLYVAPNSAKASSKIIYKLDFSVEFGAYSAEPWGKAYKKIILWKDVLSKLESNPDILHSATFDFSLVSKNAHYQITSLPAISTKHKPGEIDGNWSDWLQWGRCFCDSHKNQKRRFRHCNNPLPSKEGKVCKGNEVQLEECSDEC